MEESLLRMTFMLDMYRDAGDMPGDDADELERDRRGAIVVVGETKAILNPSPGGVACCPRDETRARLFGRVLCSWFKTAGESAHPSLH